GELLVRRGGPRDRRLYRAQSRQARRPRARGRRVSRAGDGAVHAASEPGWRDILRGVHLPRASVLAAGVALHAVSLYLSATLLPAVVADVGGMPYYAWNTSLFVVASVLGAVVAARLLAKHGPRA